MDDDYGPIPVPGPYQIPSPRNEPIPVPAPHEVPSPRTETETAVQHPEALADTGPALTDFILPLALIAAGVALVFRARLHPQH